MQGDGLLERLNTPEQEEFLQLVQDKLIRD